MQNSLTPAAIAATRKHFSDNQLACVAEVKCGAVHVNNPEKYFAQCLANSLAVLRGEWDHTMTFRQYATYLQTGEMRAILPK